MPLRARISFAGDDLKTLPKHITVDLPSSADEVVQKLRSAIEDVLGSRSYNLVYEDEDGDFRTLTEATAPDLFWVAEGNAGAVRMTARLLPLKAVTDPADDILRLLRNRTEPEDIVDTEPCKAPVKQPIVWSSTSFCKDLGSDMKWLLCLGTVILLFFVAQRWFQVLPAMEEFSVVLLLLPLAMSGGWRRRVTNNRKDHVVDAASAKVAYERCQYFGIRTFASR